MSTVISHQDMTPAKADLRRAMLALRDALSHADAQSRSAAIAYIVGRLPIFQSAATVCSYMAIGNEVDTAGIIDAALAQGKRVVLPRTWFAERRLSLHQVTTLDDLVPGRYGILEPSPDAPQVDPGDVDLFLVPGAVFDTAGNRLGYGAGFYDALLTGSRGWRVALAYACQLTPHVPVDPHDVPMQLIATEHGVIECAQGRRASDRLRLKNILCYGHHGAFPEERAHGIRLAFDIDLRLDLQLPGLTDDLATAVNYPAIYQRVMQIQGQQEYHLLEALAQRIAETILAEFAAVAEVTVTARKFNPPVGGALDAFEVEITRQRSAWRLPSHA